MKRISAMVFAVLFLAIVSVSEGAYLDTKKEQEFLPRDVFDEISRIPEKPHFLLGLEPKSDEWERFLETRKLVATKGLKYRSASNAWIDKSHENFKLSGNTEIIETVTVAGKKIRVLYTHYHFAKNGMYAFWTGFDGEKNLAEYSPIYEKYKTRWGLGVITGDQWESVKRILGWAQFEAVRSFIHKSIVGGAEKNVRDFEKMRLTEQVISSRAKMLNDPNYGKKLDNFVSGTNGLKVRDIIPVPLTRVQDFLPDLLVVGPGPFMGGFANHKTPETERIVFLDIRGLAFDYINGDHMLSAHEFVHTNPYLQGTPLSLYYDIEMWDSLTTDLQSNVTGFLFHFYLAVVRDVVRFYWGYDVKEAVKKIFPGGIMNIREVRKEEFLKHVEEVKKIRDELVRFITDPEDGFMVGFYSDPYFWTTVNTKFCDTSAAFRLMFALRYELAGIFDPVRKDVGGNVVSPVIQTKEWLMKEEEAGRIQRLAEKSLEKTGEPTKWSEKLSKGSDSSGQQKCPVHARFFLFDDQERAKFIEMIEPIVKEAKNGNTEAKILLARIFAGSGGLNGIPRP